jgi:hypothetical protein
VKRRKKAPRLGNWVTVHDPLEPGVFPSIAACYVVILNGTFMYIGSTESLRMRFLGHSIDWHPYDANYLTPWGSADSVVVKYRPTRKYGDWAMVELRLIRRLQPVLNVRGVGARKAKFGLSYDGYPVVKCADYDQPIYARVQHFVAGATNVQTYEEYRRIGGCQ